MLSKLFSFLSSINFLFCFILEALFGGILIFIGIYFWIDPGDSLSSVKVIFDFSKEIVSPYLVESNFGKTGKIFSITGFLLLCILTYRLVSIKRNKIIYFTSPHAEVNIKQLEKNLEDSLSILSGLKKSSIKIQMKVLSQTITCQASIVIDEGVHIPQIEKAIIHLLRKRIKEVLLGLAIQVNVKVNIKIEPEKNYVSYNVIQEYQGSLPHTENDQTNFPKQSGIGVESNN
ncbi:MAG: hypothetical protein COA79_01020 [Planctomycetota bacterium]|nr:MAG: hypothetical protein COA79_01020 [Planctomycetota bacterium]